MLGEIQEHGQEWLCDAGSADAIEITRGVPFNKGIVLSVRWLALGCILVMEKWWKARRLER